MKQTSKSQSKPRKVCVIGEFDIVNDLRSEYQPDSFAEGLLEDTYPEWMPERLRQQMKDALCGLTKGMALVVADNVFNCWTYGVRHYTNILYVDRLLNSLYNKILYAAFQRDVMLPNHF